MSISQAMLAEFANDAPNTRKMLEVVPEGELSWQPHEKSMALSRLTGHIAEIPGWAANVVGKDALNIATGEFQPVQVETVAELLEVHDRSVEAFQQALEGADDKTLMQPWALRNGDQVLFQLPCVAALRSFVLNHVVHHRGQLSVYLRLHDIALPQVYGPTADFQTF